MTTTSNGNVVWNSATGLVYMRNGDGTTISVAASPGWERHHGSAHHGRRCDHQRQQGPYRWHPP
ncbi:hypothetical protein [Paenarthrobacter nicotinovorans]|uniref:hypothetical protein n=1 Tax=Paenarthrobacter nicotinovorans TaxID=29320 RepID=UPI0011A1417E|nr:hypothetical protein [Paenarthrobacter nicotinovorans]